MIIKHQLANARQVISPNSDARPTGEISLVVLHSISLPPGRFGGDDIEALFTNRLDWDAHPFFQTIRGLRVSAHLLIRRDGRCIQFVPFDRRAWHAGRSRWQGRQALNDFTIGIELEGDGRAFTHAQYQCLAELLPTLEAHYPRINARETVTHEQVAPLRKSDPGPSFDQQYLLRIMTRQYDSDDVSSGSGPDTRA
ncbi:N-acetyl-anhydromuranmyl-L-alanine amidase [Kushneria pakistanensis]|uniref:1,6-anhydro-N-acetylmuramyl-L-alanine amidase AmpD n=1 Tax=Kushneria pakistanensis TaxID=1508770 RepID=A0ABQ3FAI6_9GAMM|nr:1,6-anhydro-N-acetylmuramyl-L-alanine amidase AmpD [Kushneria pakistanensis]GHC16009.1 N-acetyl-anhydromuranmyl-L-alanine amidase [Kushneria pakistanensis]